MSKVSRQFVAECTKGDAERDAGLVTPDDIVRYDDISYGEEQRWNLLDVYRPKEAEGKELPVIVNVHGGGWVYGDKEVYQFYCMSLAQRGFAVVNFNYRLAPDYKYPSQIEDINRVFKWVLKNSEEYGFDTKNIFAVGDSAGAHLLGVYTNILTNPSYAEFYPIKLPKKLKLRAVALNCGKYDMCGKTDEDPKLKTILKKDLLPGGASKKEKRLIGVREFVTKDFPPTVLMTCPGDFLKDQASLMVEALEKNGVEFRYLYYGNSKEPLWHVFHVNMRIDAAKECNDEECEFFRRRMKKDQ